MCLRDRVVRVHAEASAGHLHDGAVGVGFQIAVQAALAAVEVGAQLVRCLLYTSSQRALDAEQPDGRYAVAIAHIRAQRHDQHGGGRVAPDSTRTAEEGGSCAPHGHEP